MTDRELLYCPKHVGVPLSNVLAGGSGYCWRCSLYVQAAGVPEPAREIPRLSETEAAKVRAKGRKAKGGRKLSKADLGALSLAAGQLAAGRITQADFDAVQRRVEASNGI